MMKSCFLIELFIHREMVSGLKSI